MLTILCTAALSSPGLTQAGEVYLSPVYVQSAAVVVAPVGAHVIGNLEIRLTQPVSLPSGTSCDSTYFTTRKDVDVDGKLFALALFARAKQLPVGMWVTDDVGLNAYPGRCSVKAIAVG